MPEKLIASSTLCLNFLLPLFSSIKFHDGLVFSSQTEIMWNDGTRLFASQTQSAGGGCDGSQPGSAGMAPSRGGSPLAGLNCGRPSKDWSRMPLSARLPHRAEVVIKRAILLGKEHDVVDRRDICSAGLEQRRYCGGAAQGQGASANAGAETRPSSKCCASIRCCSWLICYGRSDGKTRSADRTASDAAEVAHHGSRSAAVGHDGELCNRTGDIECCDCRRGPSSAKLCMWRCRSMRPSTRQTWSWMPPSRST